MVSGGHYRHEFNMEQILKVFHQGSLFHLPVGLDKGEYLVKIWDIFVNSA